MGKPTKLSDRSRAWFLRGSQCRKRAIDTMPERKRILIVCEGEKTEPHYFEALGAELPKHVVELDICGEGFNTLSLVAKAQELRDKRAGGDYPFDHVWVVFDRDSFAPYHFDNAIHKAEADHIKCAWSNVAFELWYVFHFDYRTTAMPRSEYKTRLTELLGTAYRKNATDMYRQLAEKGNQAQAIAWARSLCNAMRQAHTPPSQANPCTTVHELVEQLNTFRPV